MTSGPSLPSLLDGLALVWTALRNDREGQQAILDHADLAEVCRALSMSRPESWPPPTATTTPTSSSSGPAESCCSWSSPRTPTTTDPPGGIGSDRGEASIETDSFPAATHDPAPTRFRPGGVV
jgi:hypothetical protein